MVIVFWLTLVTLVYVYVGYPALLGLIKVFRSKDSSTEAEITPSVTMVISAYNEESVIEAKIDNALALEYPSDKLSIIVVSDCSDDRTDEIVQTYEDPRLKLLRMENRSGKSIGLNHAVAQAKSDLILFTDANAMFAPQSLSLMAARFADAKVGVVTGQQRYQQDDGADDPTQEGLYWRYESTIKAWESACGNLVGGDGAIMAIRRELFFDLAEDDLSDYLLPMRISMQGHRNVYAADAFCTEEAAESYEKEHKRKVRIVNRAWRATLKCAEVLNFFKYGTLSLCVWSHKVLRWLAGLWMILLAATSLFLWSTGPIYQLAVGGQLIFYGLAFLGFAFRSKSTSSLFSIPYYFCSVNMAALQGIFEHYQGKTYATWNTPRTASK